MQFWDYGVLLNQFARVNSPYVPIRCYACVENANYKKYDSEYIL